MELAESFTFEEEGLTFRKSNFHYYAQILKSEYGESEALKASMDYFFDLFLCINLPITTPIPK